MPFTVNCRVVNDMLKSVKVDPALGTLGPTFTPVTLTVYTAPKRFGVVVGTQSTSWLLVPSATEGVPAMVLPSLRVTVTLLEVTLLGRTGSWKKKLMPPTALLTFTALEAGEEAKTTAGPAAGPTGPGPAVKVYDVIAAGFSRVVIFVSPLAGLATTLLGSMVTL